ncbi:MAG: hypothetical protein M0Q51_12880 [Bacteroidales bacterium]|nr:hypothetical protein [Bacteroidales bacterium]
MNKGDLQNIEKEIQEQFTDLTNSQNIKRVSRFILSALSSIPWVGGFLGASASLHAEIEQSKVNEILKLWLEEHKDKLEKLGQTIYGIILRLENFDSSVHIRMESDEYQDLVKKGFRVWDNSDTDDKRELIKNLLTNSCASTLCTDDIIRLFIDWIGLYHEAHFYIIKEIYQNKRITRGQIWNKIRETKPRENSAEADLFKMLIRDLSTGGVIRQFRETDYYGNFVKKTSRKPSTSVLTSAFDNTEPYELTELGKQFVHYSMSEIVPRLSE